MSDKQIVDSSFTAIINASIEKIDIPTWCSTLPEKEYQGCSPAHIAAGFTTAPDGTRMSINVEMIGSGLVVQHYVAEEARPDYVRMNSISDVFTANGRTQVNVLWELIAEDAGHGRTRYTNRVTARPTDVFLDFLGEHGIALEDAAAARQAAGSDHNRRETPLFAESIARHALARNAPAAETAK